MNSFVINIGGGIVVSKDVMNQLINFMAMQDIHPDGFEQITLSWFDRGVGDLIEAELDRLVELSPNLTKLELGFSEMLKKYQNITRKMYPDWHYLKACDQRREDSYLFQRRWLWINK